MIAQFNIYDAPSLPSVVGLVRVTANAIIKYRDEHTRVTHERLNLYDEKMYEKIRAHLQAGCLMLRKNAAVQVIKHGDVAQYLIDGLWVMVVSRDNHLLDIYRKDTQQQINETYLPYK